MSTLTDRDKKVIRIGGIIIGAYLVLFFGYSAWQLLDGQRASYRLLVKEAQDLHQRIQVYQDKAAHAQKLMEEFHLDPAKLSRDTVVGEASAAIQKMAATAGVQLGQIHEAPARSSAKELRSVQLEGGGQVRAVLALLNRLESLGYPLVIDDVQLTMEPTRPGQVKLSMTIVILDFDQWKEKPHA
jgi:hypothetical protein